MRRIWIVTTILACGAIASASACSGKTVEIGPADDDGGGAAKTDSGIAADGNNFDSALSPNCPAYPPQEKTQCAHIGIECEYGTDLNIDCNKIARCDPSGWAVSAARHNSCPTPPAVPSCPSTYQAVVSGSTCTTDATCTYGEGTCTCEVYCGSQYPLGHPCEAGTPKTWQCTGASLGCPTIRPHIGTACSQDNQYCQYGDCNSTALRCESGTWHTQMTGCPISTSRYKEGIHYLSSDELHVLASETLETPLANYQYKIGDSHPRLGFIIEDNPGSPAVVHGKDRVDLYGYTSMAIATLQVQNHQIEKLEHEVTELRKLVSLKLGSFCETAQLGTNSNPGGCCSPLMAPP